MGTMTELLSPSFSLERIEQVLAQYGEQPILYRLGKPQHGKPGPKFQLACTAQQTTCPDQGWTGSRRVACLSVTPRALVDHLAAVIPPPRRHRHRHSRVLTPNSPLRAGAVALRRDMTDDPSAPAEVAAPPAAPAPNARSPARYL